MSCSLSPFVVNKETNKAGGGLPNLPFHFPQSSLLSVDLFCLSVLELSQLKFKIIQFCASL